jgi:hypothetical protein
VNCRKRLQKLVLITYLLKNEVRWRGCPIAIWTLYIRDTKQQSPPLCLPPPPAPGILLEIIPWMSSPLRCDELRSMSGVLPTWKEPESWLTSVEMNFPEKAAALPDEDRVSCRHFTGDQPWMRTSSPFAHPAQRNRARNRFPLCTRHALQKLRAVDSYRTLCTSTAKLPLLNKNSVAWVRERTIPTAAYRRS